MQTRYWMASVCAVSVLVYALLATPSLCLADGAIHGNIGSEQYLYLNAVGDDQGNGSTRTMNSTGEYSIGGLPGDRWYVISEGHQKFYLPDGEDLEINEAPGFPAAYDQTYGPNDHKSKKLGQTVIANAEYLNSISMTQGLDPVDINCSVYEDGPSGALVWDGGIRGSGNLWWWAVWVVDPPRSVKLIPGKKYYVEFTTPTYVMVPCHNTDPYLDGMTYVKNETTLEMEPVPASDLTMTFVCSSPGSCQEYYSHPPQHASWVDSVCQSYTASGQCLKRVHCFLPWDSAQSYTREDYIFSLHEYGGPSNAVGAQVGPKKRADAGLDYSDGCGAVWDVGECPTTPGQQYLIKVTKEGGFVAWYKDTAAPQGDFFKNGTYEPGVEITGSINALDVDMLPMTISNVHTPTVGATSTVITWDTSADAMTQVEYWTWERDHQHTVLDETLTSNHSVQLTRLKGSTTYYFTVKSYREGYEYATEDGTFTTAPAGLIFGTVFDNSGQPVIGADVETSAGPFGTYYVKSESDGSFVMLDVEPGTYDVTAERDGLISATVEDLVVAAGDAALCDIVMERIGEYVSNGGFETGDFTGWPYITYSTVSGGTPEPPGVHCEPPPLLSLVSARSGSCLMNRATNWWGHNGWVGQKIAVTQGSTYRLTGYYCIFWVGGDQNAIRMWLMIDPLGRESYAYADIVRSDMITWPTGAELSPWLPVTVECTAQSDYVTAWIQYFQNVGEWRICCWDDISIARVIGGVTQAKSEMDGARIAVKDVVVTATGSQLGDKMYVESQDRLTGIQLYLGDAADASDVGDIVTVDGTLATRDGERALENCVITKTGTTTPLAPLAVNANEVGGSAFDYSPGPPASGQMGIDGCHAVNNVGLLARCAGKVVFAGDDYFVLNDGSFEGATGVKVLLPEGAAPPDLDAVVSVTGVSAVTLNGGYASPILRVRGAGDVTTVN